MADFVKLDVLRHSGDRFWWDFRSLPSLAESHERYGKPILNYCTGFAWRSNNLSDRFFPRSNLYWPECGYVGDSRTPWFLMPKTVTYAQIADEKFTAGYNVVSLGIKSAWAYVCDWARSSWLKRHTLPWYGIQLAWRGLTYVWHSVPDGVKWAGLAYFSFRCLRLLRSSWQEQRTPFDGQDNIAFCAHCTPQLLDEKKMILGNAYEKRFHVPAACPRCSRMWAWQGWKEVRMRIGNAQYQYMGTYTALRMQRERDVHCPAVNQLDIPNEYRFAHRFMQLHGGTIGAMESKQRWCWSDHTRSYCLSSQWEEIEGGDAPTYQAPRPPREVVKAATPAPSPTPKAEATTPTVVSESSTASGTTTMPNTDETPHSDDSFCWCSAPQLDIGPDTVPTKIQQMRDLWQFIYDNGGRLPQSTLVSSAFKRCKELFGKKPSPVFGVTAHYRMGVLGVGTRILDTRFMTPPPDIDMVPVALETAQAVGPVTHSVTVHNAQDKMSVMADLEGRSTVKRSVFPDPDGTFPFLFFNKSSRAATRLNKFWRKFFQMGLTNKRMDNAYHKLYAHKTFKEIVMSKFTQEEIEAIQLELQTIIKAEQLGTRKANGKLEGILKSGKPGRLVVDNTLLLLALNIIACGILQHIIFDHEDGIFYNMSIKHRARDDVLNAFGEMMKDPWGEKGKVANGRPAKVPESCAWEIDQTGMELHERCNRHGEGILGYTYNALLRINNHVSHKINGEFTGLHEAKIVHDVKTGMHIRFRMKGPEVPKEAWFTAKFPDMYLDSGWLLTSGVNFMNELSGVFCSITENPEHLFAFNSETGRFRIQEGTFDWKFKSIPLYQTHSSPAPSSFDIYLRGIFEGDDGGGAASRCLADPRNGGKYGLIIREQESLGYSAKLKTIINGRVEIIGAHFPVKDGLVCDDVPWIPAVTRYTSKLGCQTSTNITPSSRAARFLSLASMFAGRDEPLQRGFELSAIGVIDKFGKEKNFWSSKIKTDGYHEIDRAFGTGLHCTYTMADVKAHYDRCANKVYPTTQTQIRMLNMSIAEDVDATTVTRDDFCKLGLFAEECRHFDGDHESAYSLLPSCFR